MLHLYSLIIFDQANQRVLTVIPSVSRREAKKLIADWKRRRIQNTTIFVSSLPEIECVSQPRRASRAFP